MTQETFYQVNFQENIIAACLKFFSLNWSVVSSNGNNPSSVTILPPISLMAPVPHQSSKELTQLFQQQIICPADPQIPGYYSHILTDPKKNGNYRLIINMKGLNQFIPHVYFKIENIQLLQDALLPQDWMVKMDLKDAYYTIPVYHPMQELYSDSGRTTGQSSSPASHSGYRVPPENSPEYWSLLWHIYERGECCSVPLGAWIVVLLMNFLGYPLVLSTVCRCFLSFSRSYRRGWLHWPSQTGTWPVPVSHI